MNAPRLDLLHPCAPSQQQIPAPHREPSVSRQWQASLVSGRLPWLSLILR
jgi:hypothetical protein